MDLFPPFLYGVLTAALLVAGCIQPIDGGADDGGPALPSFSSFYMCHGDEADEFEGDCDANALPATLLSAVPDGAVCVADYDTHRVYADGRGKLVLEFDQIAPSAAFVSGAFYQPRSSTGGAAAGYTVGTQRFQWTAEGGSNVVSLNLAVDDFLLADAHRVRFAGLDVTATGAAADAVLSVQWMLMDDDQFDPIYRFASALEHPPSYFRGAVPLVVEGSDFTLRIDHYDNIPPGSGAANQANGCT